MNFPFQPAFIEGLGGPEMVLILLIVLVLFGGKKLPEFAKGLGKSIREFKKAASGIEEEIKRAMEEEPAKPAAPTPLPAPHLAVPVSSHSAPALLPAAPAFASESPPPATPPPKMMPRPEDPGHPTPHA